MCSVAAELVDLARKSLDRGIEALRQCAESAMSAGELADLLRTTASQRNQLDYAFTELVAELDDKLRFSDEPDDPATSCAGFLSDALRMNGRAAWAQVRVARQLRDLPATAERFADGEISYQHAVTIGRVMERIDRGRPLGSHAEPQLLEAAERLDPYNLLLEGRHIRHQVNPSEVADEEEEERQQRWLRLTRKWNGGYDIEGHLDAEAGTALKVALDAEMGPKKKDDERPAAERRADALHSVVRRVLDSGTLPVRGGVRPHILLTASVETLLGEPGSRAAVLDWLYPVSREFLLRVAEDADLTPILVDGAGNPLFAGRTRRTASRKMRLALGLRDGHCVWPGCDRPPSWTDAAHRQPWVEGGRTNVNEMVQMCRLCRGRHKRHYADVPFMPSWTVARVGAGA